MKYKIAVVIPTRNRRGTLVDTVQSVLEQDIPTDVLVMDDASTDGTPEVIRTIFPQVRVYSAERSLGPTFQRNRGAELTLADILFTIDDDITLPSRQTMRQTLAAFDHPQIGAVTIPFINVRQDHVVHTRAPDSYGIYVGFDFFGGMVAIRREAFVRAGGYRPYLFMMGEEGDLAIRIMNAGYVIRLGTADPMHHHRSAIRDNVRIETLSARNHTLYAWYNVPFPYLTLQIVVSSARAWLLGVRTGFTLARTRGLFCSYGACLHEWSRRRPVRRSVYELSRRLKKCGWIRFEDVVPYLPPPRVR
jgi:glycosyltransferase involved in cell wall biosynthesis